MRGVETEVGRCVAGQGGKRREEEHREYRSDDLSSKTWYCDEMIKIWETKYSVCYAEYPILVQGGKSRTIWTITIVLCSSYNISLCTVFSISCIPSAVSPAATLVSFFKASCSAIHFRRVFQNSHRFLLVPDFPCQSLQCSGISSMASGTEHLSLEQ